MNLQEMKAYKKNLIVEGHEAYPTIAKIVDTLGEFKTLRGRNYFILEYDGITAIHSRNISGANIGKNSQFLGWLYQDYLFVTVGEEVAFCPFRRDRVMSIHLDNDNTVVTQSDKDNEIFVPYHKDWYNRIMSLLPKAEGILGEASHNDSQAEMSKLSKELFLEEKK
jgi:hypothetical protein